MSLRSLRRRRRPVRRRGRPRTDVGRYAVRAFVSGCQAFIVEERANGTTVLDFGMAPVHRSQLVPGETILVGEGSEGAFRMGFL